MSDQGWSRGGQRGNGLGGALLGGDALDAVRAPPQQGAPHLAPRLPHGPHRDQRSLKTLAAAQYMAGPGRAAGCQQYA
jgi:hypothetical protein